MLIKALCDYYDTLKRDGKVIPEKFSVINVNYIISLTEDGDIDGVIDCREYQTVIGKNGKEKTVSKSKEMTFPRRTEKPGIEANFVEFRPKYLFGLCYDKKTECLSSKEDKNTCEKAHMALVKKVSEYYEDCSETICIAYRKFIEKWCPSEETENPYLMAINKDFNSNYAFCLSGHPETLLHESKEIINKWLAICAEDGKDDVFGQCAIYGTEQPIARIHDKISGVPDGKGTGNSLIGFNNKSDESYGKTQSINSGVSVSAMKHYTQALNYLYHDKNHHTKIYDCTLLHWANSSDDTCNALMGALIDASEIDESLKTLAQGMISGRIDIEEDLNKYVDDSVEYFIAALKPNSTRLALRSLYRQSIGETIHNLVDHQRDLQITENAKPISFSRIARETVYPNSKHTTPNPTLVLKMVEAAYCGYRYPPELLATILRRIRNDSDTEDNYYIKINSVRMGIIKAYINRNDRLDGRKEEITMSLSKSNENPAYVCGRIFAMLEEIQRRSTKGAKLNRTITDSYFASASTRPATVFPKLLHLAQYHMAKYDESIFDKQRLSEVVGLLGNEFPDTLTLKEQGIFMLGYYQQRDDTFKRIAEAKKNKENNSNNDKEINYGKC